MPVLVSHGGNLKEISGNGSQRLGNLVILVSSQLSPSPSFYGLHSWLEVFDLLQKQQKERRWWELFWKISYITNQMPSHPYTINRAVRTEVGLGCNDYEKLKQEGGSSDTGMRLFEKGNLERGWVQMKFDWEGDLKRKKVELDGIEEGWGLKWRREGTRAVGAEEGAGRNGSASGMETGLRCGPSWNGKESEVMMELGVSWNWLERGQELVGAKMGRRTRSGAAGKGAGGGAKASWDEKVKGIRARVEWKSATWNGKESGLAACDLAVRDLEVRSLTVHGVQQSMQGRG